MHTPVSWGGVQPIPGQPFQTQSLSADRPKNVRSPFSSQPDAQDEGTHPVSAAWSVTKLRCFRVQIRPAAVSTRERRDSSLGDESSGCRGRCVVCWSRLVCCSRGGLLWWYLIYVVPSIILLYLSACPLFYVHLLMCVYCTCTIWREQGNINMCTVSCYYLECSRWGLIRVKRLEVGEWGICFCHVFTCKSM